MDVCSIQIIQTIMALEKTINEINKYQIILTAIPRVIEKCEKSHQPMRNRQRTCYVQSAVLFFLYVGGYPRLIFEGKALPDVNAAFNRAQPQ